MTRPVPSRAYPPRGQLGRVVHTLGARIAGGDLAPESMRQLMEGARDDLRFYAGAAET